MGSWIRFLWFQRTTEAWQCVAWSESLRGSPESPLHEAVKTKTELQWRSHKGGHRRTMGFLLRKTVAVEWNQPKEIWTVGNTSGGGELQKPLRVHLILSSIPDAETEL